MFWDVCICLCNVAFSSLHYITKCNILEHVWHPNGVNVLCGKRTQISSWERLCYSSLPTKISRSYYDDREMRSAKCWLQMSHYHINYSWEQEVLLYPESTHTLLSFNDIRANGLQLRPMLWKVRILLITKRENGKHLLESFFLYWTQGDASTACVHYLPKLWTILPLAW